MCQPATWRTCKKATYRGCGMRVEQVLAGVPKSQWCNYHRTQTSASGGLLAWLRRR